MIFWAVDVSAPGAPEGVIDQPVYRHSPRLGHDDFDGGLAGGGVLGEHIHDEKEQQRAFGAEHRVKASTGAVKSLERAEEAFQSVRRIEQMLTLRDVELISRNRDVAEG